MPVEPPSADTARPLRIAGPCAIAFIASASVMIVELLAFRLVARYLGSSNYTVTAIIGVILGGLAIGNLIGGRLADRFRAGRTLSILFVLSSAGCFAVPVLNRWVGEWPALWLITWPQRIALHVSLTFSLPAMLLGTIGPVVAKMALERSFHIGRTVGSVYAFGALGSIVGTFACGYYLIPFFGNDAVIHSVGLLLAIMAIVCAANFWAPYGWAGASAVILCLGLGPWSWARSIGADCGLRERITPDVLFDADSEYSHVRVEQSHDVPGLRYMLLDKLVHSYINVNRTDALLYGYERIFTTVTDVAAGSRTGIRALVLGGGGYTHPRYILRRRPESHVDVVEIDPVVTQAAISAFGLRPDPRMTIAHLDGRQYVADLVRRKKAGENLPAFDFAFLDAINDYNVPFHLTTREFQEMIHSLLGENGVFMTNLIDIMDVGGVLGSMFHTTRQTFPYVECFFAGAKGEPFDPSVRYTFVVVASKTELHLERLADDPATADVGTQRLSREQLQDLEGRRDICLLTDNHAPLEYFLAGVITHEGADVRRQEAALLYYSRGNERSALRRYAEAIESFNRALDLDPTLHLAHLNAGLAYVELRQFDEAAAAFKKAAALRPDLPEPLINLGGVRMLLHDYAAAAMTYEQAVKINPAYPPSYNALGMALGNLGRLAEARTAFRHAIELKPDFDDARSNLDRVESALQTSTQPAASQSGR